MKSCPGYQNLGFAHVDPKSLSIHAKLPEGQLLLQYLPRLMDDVQVICSVSDVPATPQSQACKEPTRWLFCMHNQMPFPDQRRPCTVLLMAWNFSCNLLLSKEALCHLLYISFMTWSSSPIPPLERICKSLPSFNCGYTMLSNRTRQLSAVMYSLAVLTSRRFSEVGPSPTSLSTLRVGHECSHPGLGPALQTVQWSWTLPHLPVYLAGGPRVLPPGPRPRTADSSVKVDPPPPPCLPCGWATSAHTRASAPHCKQFSEGGPSLTSLLTLRVGHECSYPGLGPALVDSSMKLDPPPPPCLPCGWATSAHTRASAPHCRQFSEVGPSPTSLPTLRVGHQCSHPGLGPALQRVQWSWTLPHLPWGWAMSAHTRASAPHCRQFSEGGPSPTSLPTVGGGPRVLPPRPRPRTADSSVKLDPPPPPCLPCGWATSAPTPAPHCKQFSEGGPSLTSLPTSRVGHECSHPDLGSALQTVQWRWTLPHLPAYLAGGPRVLPPRPRPRTADSSVKVDPPSPPCLPCGWATSAPTPASAPHCRQFSEGGPSNTSLPTSRVVLWVKAV